ncbi:hypothetical protein EVG20_g7327 [Dentipellis fragilis]|uniref:MYND-type domain-containing protein n=1 Tax=Dentipellis fragilis TaxID=205917 RepID=A0A4Y9YER2_9AGAM|nr:hypothetical protein EVG20_g7327 [Dentipellis fragilis]
MSQADFLRAMQEVQRSPKQTIKAAKEGNIVSIKVTANNIQAVPQLQTKEVLEMIHSHLSEAKALDPTKPAAPRSPAALTAERAFAAIMALGNFGPFLMPPNKPLLDLVAKGWPGIWKWIKFFYAINTNPRAGSAEQRRNSLEMVAYALYSITHDDAIQATISATPGLIALSTLLWLAEDPNFGSQPTMLPIPVTAAALHHVLFNATQATINEVVKVSGGKSSIVAETALTRLRNALAKPVPDPAHVHAHINVLVTLTRPRKHAVRRAVLRRGGIGLITRALVRVSTMPLQGPNVDAVIAGFGFISNLIEAGEGIRYVRQAVREGLLQAFVNVSPSFARLDAEAREFILALVSDTLPRYLVYRSVILVVDNAMQKLETPEARAKIEKSPVRDSWYKTRKLAAERLMIKWSHDTVKTEAAHCDYCRKQGQKETFRNCSRCHVTRYCSKECQVAGWNSGHREECRLKKEEQLVLEDDAIQKEDRLFHHHLAIRDARHHIPLLRRLAAKELPGVPLAKVGVSIDYTRVPEVYGVFALEGHDLSKEVKKDAPRVSEARSENIVEKALKSEGRASLVESKICVGEGCSVVLTLTAQPLWETNEVTRNLPGYMDDEEGWLDRTGEFDTTVDDIDIMMARNVIRSFVEKHEGPEAAAFWDSQDSADELEL